jgi:NAD(P)-dependent dehydrogenase (short-subunit alcohol dehydrogenase family)
MGASQGIGAGAVKAFLARSYDVVGTSRNATKSKELSASDHLALIDGNIGQFETARKVAELAIKKFGSIISFSLATRPISAGRNPASASRK